MVTLRGNQSFCLGFAIKGFGSYLLCLYTYCGSLMTSRRCLLPLASVYDFLTKTCESYEGVHRISAFLSLPIYFILFIFFRRSLAKWLELVWNCWSLCLSILSVWIAGGSHHTASFLPFETAIMLPVENTVIEGS